MPVKNLSEHAVPHRERVTSHSVSSLLMSLPPGATGRVGGSTESAPGLQAFDGGLSRAELWETRSASVGVRGAEPKFLKPEARAEGIRFVGQEDAISLSLRFGLRSSGLFL